jgi:hypothetical protein
MSLLDDYMLSHNDECDSTMGTSVMVCAGQTFNIVVNLATRTVDGDNGGLEIPVQNIATAQPKNVNNPRALLNKRCTIDGVQYRVHGVDIGTVAIHFTLTDPNESR